MSEQSLVLVDKTEYEDSDSLVLWIPTDISGAGEFGGVGLKVTIIMITMMIMIMMSGS